jgi:hypothetical protein
MLPPEISGAVPNGRATGWGKYRRRLIGLPEYSATLRRNEKLVFQTIGMRPCRLQEVTVWAITGALQLGRKGTGKNAANYCQMYDSDGFSGERL